MTNGIILAGGRGSRLGPLSAQISKALVSIGQRPHLFHQLELLAQAGCEHIVVVTSPSTYQQVKDMLRRSGVTRGNIMIDVIVQEEPEGPVDAIRCGLESGIIEQGAGVYVLMSDTFITEPLDHGVDSWVGVAPAPTTRRFCAVDDDDDAYVDRNVPTGTSVTIGAYYFSDVRVLHSVVTSVLYSTSQTSRVDGMGPLLTNLVMYGLDEIDFTTWLDIGDVIALGKARQTRFITRAQHKLTLDDAGLITKHGEGEDFQAQVSWLIAQHALPPASANLVPQLYDVSSTSYTMEYVDLPTLSELWLYWPGRSDTWHDILDSIVQRLKRDLWSSITSKEFISPDEEVALFVRKAHDRLLAWNPKKCAEVVELLQQATRFFDGSPTVRAHGDLNFNNILYSLNTGMIKLVDPRGDTFLPLSYELAKLRYSYHGGFAAITHGLTSLDWGLLPSRLSEIIAMDEVVSKLMSLEKCTIAEACLLLAGAPLHNDAEAEVMFQRGKWLLEEQLS